jgi:uncharacterized protein (DUF433 family)
MAPNDAPAASEAATLLEGTWAPVPPPLSLYEGKTARVAGTRIPLERAVYAHNSGRTPEQIQSSFPTLCLADVYAVIAYYLRHREEVDRYVREGDAGADAIERQVRAEFPSDELRERLLARRAKAS